MFPEGKDHGVELSPQNIKEHFDKRRNTLEMLDRELDTLGKVLLQLLPPSLDAFKNEAFWDMKKWLTDLENNTKAGSFNSIKIKDPSEYGFASRKDAFQKMQQLKEAWDGIINVKITNENYVEVKFRLVR